MLRRISLAVFTCLTLAITAGCGNLTGSDGSGVAGTYTLETVNGDRIPYTFRLENGVATLTYKEGRVILKGDSTFTIAVTYVISPAYQGVGTYTDDGGGTFTLKEGAVRLIRTDRQQNHVGTLRKNTLTLTIDTGAFVFHR